MDQMYIFFMIRECIFLHAENMNIFKEKNDISFFKGILKKFEAISFVFMHYH